MKHLLKNLILYTLITAILLFSAVPIVSADSKVKCTITVNGENADWKTEPFLAYGPQGNVMIMMPIEQLFASIGYTVTYDSKLNRSVFTANKDADCDSFYIDIKTGQTVKEGDEIKKGALNQVYLVNDIIYVYIFDLEKIVKSFLSGYIVDIDYKYVYSKNENYITKYNDYYTIHYNLSSLKIEIYEKYPDHPFTGGQYTKYNTGNWISGEKIKSKFREITLESLWDGFDNLRFYTGKGEKNELSGKNASAYAIAWELMDAVTSQEK